MPNTVLGDASRLIPDPIGIRCFNTLASLLDLGSVGNRKRPMQNASTFLLVNYSF